MATTTPTRKPRNGTDPPGRSELVYVLIVLTGRGRASATSPARCSRCCPAPARTRRARRPAAGGAAGWRQQRLGHRRGLKREGRRRRRHRMDADAAARADRRRCRRRRRCGHQRDGRRRCRGRGRRLRWQWRWRRRAAPTMRSALCPGCLRKYPFLSAKRSCRARLLRAAAAAAAARVAAAGGGDGLMEER